MLLAKIVVALLAMPQWLESLLDSKRGFFLITGSFGGSFVVGLVASLVLGLHDYAHANCPTKRERMDKKCTSFFLFLPREMTEFRLGKSSWRNSVRVKNAQGGAAHTDPGELKNMRNSITPKFILRCKLS